MTSMFAVPYAYPEHLRASLEGLPDAPGVYLFHGEEETGLPLYVGKSVRIRTRVLSHLRNPQEARLLRQARRISHLLTGGEVGALLLESQLIKRLQPLHNRRLRASRQLYGWQWVAEKEGEGTAPARLHLVHAGEVDFARTVGLFGLYRSRQAALAHLADLADQHGLCLQAVGVEKGRAGQQCFRHAIKRCAGACCGRVDPLAHARGWLDALEGLRLRVWPYAGPVGLVERHGEVEQVHVIHDWCYLGSAPSVAAARRLTQAQPRYDVDSYRILVSPLLAGEAAVVVL